MHRTDLERWLDVGKPRAIVSFLVHDRWAEEFMSRSARA
jgi:hypothetical protein